MLEEDHVEHDDIGEESDSLDDADGLPVLCRLVRDLTGTAEGKRGGCRKTGSNRISEGLVSSFHFAVG